MTPSNRRTATVPLQHAIPYKMFTCPKIPVVVCRLTQLSQVSSQQCQQNLPAHLTDNTQL